MGVKDLIPGSGKRRCRMKSHEINRLKEKKGGGRSPKNEGLLEHFYRGFT